MKDVQSYIAPTATATLIDCYTCKGQGKSSETVRVVSTNGHEQIAAQPCHTCHGSGKLWEDVRDSIKSESYHLAELIAIGIILLVIAATGIWCLVSGSVLGLLAWMAGSTVLSWFLAAMFTKEKHTVRETFYTPTGDKVDVRQQLMRN